ncbi:MAG: family 43 glycosylhydrolase [Roseburia sp.]|nr:family 43 glycosylhydrolase [Roseburia sp.]
MLQNAIERRDLEKVKQIIAEEQTAIEGVTLDGVPLALHAARMGNAAIVKYIVEYSRASMNLVDENNRTILHYAAESGDVEMNRYLVEKVGMDICAGDNKRITPYQIAYEAKNVPLLAYYESVVGVKYEEMYHNPIRTGMFPDPSIVRVGGDYYMVNSSFVFFPSIPISHSKDLIHWEIIGHAITNPEWAALEELEGGRGFWAPDISYDNGKFYIAATYRLNDTGTVYRKQFVMSSDRPEGPYSKPAVIDEDGIDPSIFHEDGRHYMLLNRGARILELSEDCTEKISEASLLYYGDMKRAPEGPHLLKKDGYYYLFLAEGGTGPGHRITVARSKTLMGNYEPCPYNPIMRQMDEKAAIQRAGHGKPVCTQNGEWYMVYLCGRMIGEGYSMLGRETALDPITWTADGWPLVNMGNGPSVLQKKPNLPEFCPSEDGERFKWVTPRAPEPNGVTFLKKGYRVKGSRYPLSKVEARNILLQRQTSFCFSAKAVMKVPHLEIGQEAGVTCYYDENTWVNFYLGRNEAGLYVQVKEHIGMRDIVHQAESLLMLQILAYGGQKMKASEDGRTQQDAYITFYVDTEYLNRKFSYQIGTEKIQLANLDNIYYLCDEGIRMGKRFTGAMIGMYAYAGEKPLEAEFVEFTYEAKGE